jgi:tetratricopeptide (TPR) repeat protein
MRTDHPTDTDIKSFLKSLARSTDAQSTAKVVRHLLADCSSCGSRFKRLSMADDYDYSPAFAAAEASLNAFLAQGTPPQVPPEVMLSELESLSQEERLRTIGTDSRFHSPSLVERLIEQSHSLRYRCPQEMLHFAELARAAAEACPVEAMGSERLFSDLKARGWMQYANALRVCSQFTEADKAFSVASRYRAAGTRDPLLRARLSEQLASLRTCQGRYREAIELAEEAGSVYQELEESHSLASTMIQIAVASLYANDPEEAIRTLNAAIPLIDSEKNPHLLLAACNNLVHSYIALDKPEQALSLYFEVRGLYKDFDDELNLLRVGWQEGQLLRDLGHLHAAEAALLEARKGFLARDLAQEVAVVSLDLAWVYVKLGWIDKLKETVTEMVPIFRALGVGREVLAALLQLQHAEGQEQKALELIRLLNTRLSPLHRTTNK